MLRNKKLSTHKITQKEYYNNVLTTANAECIIKVVGVKPFEKRSASQKDLNAIKADTLDEWRLLLVCKTPGCAGGKSFSKIMVKTPFDIK